MLDVNNNVSTHPEVTSAHVTTDINWEGTGMGSMHVKVGIFNIRGTITVIIAVIFADFIKENPVTLNDITHLFTGILYHKR